MKFIPQKGTISICPASQPTRTLPLPYLRRMRFQVFIAALILPAMLLAQGMSHQEKKVRKLLAKGKAYPALRVATGALSHLEQPVFYGLRAAAWNTISEFEKAEADARTAVRLMPDSAVGLLQLAIAEQGLGRMDSAAAHLHAALGKGASEEARYRLAEVERSRGDLPAARAAILTALDETAPENENRERFFRMQGELAAEAGDTALARSAFRQAIAMDPRDPVNYNSRGYWLEAANGRHAAAVADYDRAIKLNPNYSYAFNNRGWSHYKLGETDQALKDIQRARKRKVRNPYIYRNLGVIALESGDTAKACVNFRQALELGFTAQHGDEVEKLVLANCGGTVEKPVVPVQAPKSNTDRNEDKPVPRTNAPE
jgi:tetratricopeptide (TPR) repeat protein